MEGFLAFLKRRDAEFRQPSRGRAKEEQLDETQGEETIPKRLKLGAATATATVSSSNNPLVRYIPLPLMASLFQQLSLSSLRSLIVVDKSMFVSAERVFALRAGGCPASVHDVVQRKLRYMRDRLCMERTGACSECWTPNMELSIVAVEKWTMTTTSSHKGADDDDDEGDIQHREVAARCNSCGFCTSFGFMHSDEVGLRECLYDGEPDHRDAKRRLLFCANHKQVTRTCVVCIEEDDDRYQEYYDSECCESRIRCPSCDRFTCSSCSLFPCSYCGVPGCSDCNERYRGRCFACLPADSSCANGCSDYPMTFNTPIERAVDIDTGNLYCHRCVQENDPRICFFCDRLMYSDPSACQFCEDPCCDECSVMLEERDCTRCGLQQDSILCPECTCGVCEQHLCAGDDGQPVASMRCCTCAENVHRNGDCATTGVFCRPCRDIITQESIECPNNTCMMCGHQYCFRWDEDRAFACASAQLCEKTETKTPWGGILHKHQHAYDIFAANWDNAGFLFSKGVAPPVLPFNNSPLTQEQYDAMPDIKRQCCQCNEQG